VLFAYLQPTVRPIIRRTPISKLTNKVAFVNGGSRGIGAGIAKRLAAEGVSITVNNIQPGPVDTDLNPASSERATRQTDHTALNCYGKIDEVVSLMAFIASPESSCFTGTSLTVDGGTNA